MFLGIKHLAFAVQSVDAAAGAIKKILGIDPVFIKDTQAAYRVAKIMLGGEEFQFCSPLPGDTRFTSHMQRFGEGLHHVCFSVEDIDGALAQAQSNGASLQMCVSCGVTGKHAHPEGYIAFLADDSVPGIQIELMQVYKEGEKPGTDRNI